jgi:2-desacetyl-2-hydroxyethyl bacteriochlorophyllide A dehydrogenase
MLARQLWFTTPGQVEIKEKPLPKVESDQVLVKSICSGISTGTEMLVFRGQLPEGLPLDTTIDDLKYQKSTYPLRYGYSTVGTILEVGKNIDKSYIGKNVFIYAPHASHTAIPLDQVFILSSDISPENASFLANMETAVNLVQDGKPLLGEKVAVIGLGIVGILTTAILSKFPLAQLFALENYQARCQTLTKVFGCQAFSPETIESMDDLRTSCIPNSPESGVDLCYELTGNPIALDLAVELSGYNSRIIVGSWYGNKSSPLNLGGKFHRNRLKLISSQVSTIEPELTGRWDKNRRLTTACDMIKQINPEKLISKTFEFDQAQQAYNLLDSSPEDTLQVLLKY